MSKMKAIKGILYLVNFLLGGFAQAQSDRPVLEVAREWAMEKAYKQAMAVIVEELDYHPDSHDLLAYKARLHLWMGEFNSAGMTIDTLFSLYPNDYETYEISVIRVWWMKDWKSLNSLTTQALIHFPRNKNFLFKKMLALQRLERYQEAILFYKKSRDPVLDDLAKEVRFKHHQQLGIITSYSQFSQAFDPWLITTLKYQKVSRTSFNISGTYGRLFNQTGLSANGEFYGKIGTHINGYIEAGGSVSDIFPSFRVGAEGSYMLKKTELIAGVKFLQFPNQASPYMLGILGLGTYVDQYYLNYKAYLAKLEQSSRITHTFLARVIFDDRFHYVQLNLTHGSVPLQISSSREILRVGAYSILLLYNRLLFSNVILSVSAGYQGEQYPTGSERSRYTGQIEFSWMF